MDQQQNNQRVRVQKGKRCLEEEECKHEWQQDMIDLTPDRSMMVWSCSKCHEISKKKK